MSRTFRKKRKSDDIVRDKDFLGFISDNKTKRNSFSRATTLKDELRLHELENDLSRTRDNQIYLRERQILSYTWNVPISKIDLIYSESAGELCIYVDNDWRGYLDENLPLTDGHSWFVISNGKYIGIDEPLI